MGSGRGASSGLPTTPGRGCGQGMWARAGDRGWGQGLRVGAGDRGCGSRQGLEGGGCGQGAVGRGWGTEGSHRVPLTIGVRQQRGPDCRQLCPCCPQLCLALNIWEGKGSGSVPCQGCLRAPACSQPLPAPGPCQASPPAPPPALVALTQGDEDCQSSPQHQDHPRAHGQGGAQRPAGCGQRGPKRPRCGREAGDALSRGRATPGTPALLAEGWGRKGISQLPAPAHSIPARLGLLRAGLGG